MTTPDRIARVADTLSPVSRKALLHLHTTPSVWRHLPGAIRKKLRTEHLVVQTRNDEWELSEIGHAVRKHLTKKEN